MEKTDQIADWLAFDRKSLFATIVGQMNLPDELDFGALRTDEFKTQSGLKHSFAIGSWLSQRIKFGDETWRFLAAHSNNVVREWAAIIVGLTDSITFSRKLAWMKPFADDEHPGLRPVFQPVEGDRERRHGAAECQ